MFVSSLAAETSRRLPRGWAHLALQFVIWMGFYAVYQMTRGVADRSAADAFANGEWVLRTERELGALFEPAVRQAVLATRFRLAEWRGRKVRQLVQQSFVFTLMR